MSRIINKPWGHEEIFAETDKYVGKILHIKAGERLSLQYHEKKSESIRVIKGGICLEYGYMLNNLYDYGPPYTGPEAEEARRKRAYFSKNEKILTEGDSFDIPAGMVHRMIGIEDADVVEVSTPELDDVVRLEDDYNRI